MSKPPKKNVLVSNGTTGQTGTTRASTKLGYLKAAKHIWPYAGTFNGLVRVLDTDTDEIVFEQRTSFYS